MNDYQNVVTTLSQGEDSRVLVAFDYQEYFDPALDAADWRKRLYTKFVDGALGYVARMFEPWLARLVRSKAA